MAAVEPEGHHMRVLAAEDNPVFRAMLRSMLSKWGYDPVMARDGNEAWEILDAPDAPKLALLDWMMPGMDGVEICRRIRTSAREAYVYILLLTARTESEDLVEGMEAGADDYLTKPLVTHELRVRLRAGRRILDLQSELMAAREVLRIQAMHDTLTGILNRGSIAEALQNELARASREQYPVAVLLSDVDRFKSINDTYGHQAGDAVLHETAQRMKSAMRRYDFIGRYGGEEFLIVLPGCDGSGAYAQAERIRLAMSQELFTLGANAVSVTCSVGVSWRAEPSQFDATALIREADLALYTAKARGRNRVESFTPGLAA
jgi:diguanylate cyclase (GGDEF)-like protein